MAFGGAERPSTRNKETTKKREKEEEKKDQKKSRGLVGKHRNIQKQKRGRHLVK